MKIRRILATAVAAAVTTPVVLLSAAPAFAGTEPSSASPQKPAAGKDAKPPTHKELQDAVTEAQKAHVAAVAVLDKAKADRKALDKADHPLVIAYKAAVKAVNKVGQDREAAGEKLSEAEKAQRELTENATPEQREAAAAAVELAKKALAEIEALVPGVVADKERTGTALRNAIHEADNAIDIALSNEEVAIMALEKARADLAAFEAIGQECAESKTVKVVLGGPKKVTAGTSAVFSLRVSNTSKKTLDEVEAYAFAAALPDSIEEEDFFKEYITVEWSSADVLEWTPVTEDKDAIEVGKLVKGGHYDVKLRLTVDPETPAGPGVVFAIGAYENEDRSCGIGQEPATAQFDILAAKGDKPKPKPTPSPSTTTPAPVPTTGTTGTTGTTQQGGSSSTPVTNGSLAATGSNDALPMIGLAAAGAVALGAGAVFVARRRKAGSQA
ncbi:peptidase [Streptomyces sp. NPDC057235]|uniref:peptidase n=1 Tax=Streptomyces sp. NPDC057235 TaxID=3346058 RepID=UPI00363D9B42